MKVPLRIGIYGGTFDPLHNAHLQLAGWVVRAIHLDLLYFIPSAQHPFKRSREITPAEIRFEMLQKVFSGSKTFKVSRIELNKPGVSYTIDTLKSLKRVDPFHHAQLYLIIGEDNLREFDLWKDPEELFNLAEIIVLNRPGKGKTPSNTAFRQRMIMLSSPRIDISSTDIREKIRAGKSVEHLIPEQVWTIIQKYHLYGFTGKDIAD